MYVEMCATTKYTDVYRTHELQNLNLANGATTSFTKS